MYEEGILVVQWLTTHRLRVVVYGLRVGFQLMGSRTDNTVCELLYAAYIELGEYRLNV